MEEPERLSRNLFGLNRAILPKFERLEMGGKTFPHPITSEPHVLFNHTNNGGLEAEKVVPRRPGQGFRGDFVRGGLSGKAP